ncbi:MULTISPECIES: hypothetical protein [unclassified Clostridium]|uniref:hypothetical protein n=1 Tax=unclassified Clostridium TaxID=2614128 RepID=UPI0025BAE245|nr:MULTISPECIES: hypothetical protein [unclassified Clostridium]
MEFTNCSYMDFIIFLEENEPYGLIKKMGNERLELDVGEILNDEKYEYKNIKRLEFLEPYAIRVETKGGERFVLSEI